MMFTRKKYSYNQVFLILLFFIAVDVLAAATLKLVTYNILNFPDALGLQRTDDLRVVIEYLDPDILVVQEMQSQQGVSLFLDSVMNYEDNIYSAVPFNDGSGTDNALFYRRDRVDYLYAQYLSTAYRDIAEYRLRTAESQEELYIYSLHLKSSQGSSNEEIRSQQASILREHLDQFVQGTNFLVMGDFNIYYADESAFQILTGSYSNNNGRMFDPLDASGYWHDNIDFAHIHTQSTRTEQLNDGGAGGGLDDRFDMILCSQSLLDSSDLYLSTNSYTTCGNDGNHFNSSINAGYNQSVPDSVADALYYASDHLPVFVEMTSGAGQVVAEDVVKVWPNPMHHEAQIEFPWVDDFDNAEVTITNILGQRVFEYETRNPVGFTLTRGKLPVGIYFLHVEIKSRFNEYSYRSKIAVIQ